MGQIQILNTKIIIIETDTIMIQQVTLSQVSPVFIRVAKANGYEIDLSAATTQQQSNGNGFIIYEKEFATIYEKGMVAACVLQLNEQNRNQSLFLQSLNYKCANFNIS